MNDDNSFDFGINGTNNQQKTILENQKSKIKNKKGLILGRMIASTIRHKGFKSFIIIGDRDVGKSTYALKALHEAFLQLDYTDKESWEMALSCIKFQIPEVTKYLREGTNLYKETRTKKPAIIWDDLRRFATGLNYFLNKELYSEISGLLDTIKIPINVFIGTCPSMEGTMKILQGYDGYQIVIKHHSKGGRLRSARGYLWATSPKGQRAIYKKFDDTFVCWLPTKIWQEYEKDRIRASEESIEAVDKASKKKK